MAAWVVVTPLLGGAIAFLSRRPAAQVAATACGIGTMLLSFGVLWQVWIGGVQRLRVGGWGAVGVPTRPCARCQPGVW